MAIDRRAVAALAASAAALVGIALHEGFRDRAYDDGVGVQTIGFGTTAGVRPGDRITVERALVRLADDVSSTERGLQACMAGVHLHQHEWDSLVSWTYNVGVGAACRSTLVKRARMGDYAGMCAELSRWTFAGGRELPGLVKRRADERARCEGRA
jgi:lysozyme